ncbi:MAG TPA: hypothetical protein VK644_08695 [Chitinophagaceae bacterium]|nr:hypothetical protein [Chitinophagaceae bacterium]
MQSLLSRVTLSVTIAIFSGTISGCNETSQPGEANDPAPAVSSSPTPNVFEKLLGTWKNKDNGNFEHWVKKPDGSFHSAVFHIRNNDTVFTERANIYQEDSIWVFENVVKDQNAGKAVRFLATVLSGTNVQFSNPAHDFPTDVNYSVPDDSTVNAFIVGPNEKGTKDTVHFNYKRVKS